MGLIEKIKGVIISEGLIPDGARVVVGISGGPDSLTLSHVLLRLSSELGFSLHAVHVDHGLRGEESDGDRGFVEEWCSSNGLPLTVKPVDVNALATERSMSVEEAGRAARQAAFIEAADAMDSGAVPVRIAVAHNAGDQAETILMRILRGTGTDGLAGMPLARDDGAGHVMIRPLLHVSRAEIEVYCAENGLNPRHDSTNSDTKYHRNLLRLRIMPALQEVLGVSAAPALVRLGRNAAEDRDYFERLTETLIDEHVICQRIRPPDTRIEEHAKLKRPLDIAGDMLESNSHDGVDSDIIIIEARVPRSVMKGMHPAVRHRFVRKVFAQIGLVRDISAVHLTAADSILAKNEGGKSVDFPGGYKFAIEGKDIVFKKPEKGNPPTRVEKRSQSVS